jgi:quinol monooxygenase YgiN
MNIAWWHSFRHPHREKLAALATASRALPGVVSFDVAQDVTDPAIFISTEVY